MAEVEYKNRSPPTVPDIVVRPASPPSYEDTAAIGRALSDDALMMRMFEEWIVDYQPVYSDDEEKKMRFEIFKDTAKLAYEDSGCCIGVFADRSMKDLPDYGTSDDDDEKDFWLHT